MAKIREQAEADLVLYFLGSPRTSIPSEQLWTMPNYNSITSINVTLMDMEDTRTPLK